MGRILPAEIAEHVFESALEVEGIPSHPSVKENVMVEFQRYQRHLRWKKPRPKSVVRTRSLYR
jgi:hypothetical protein